MAYSKTVVGITMNNADTLTRYQRQFPLHIMDDSYIAVEGVAFKLLELGYDAKYLIQA